MRARLSFSPWRATERWYSSTQMPGSSFSPSSYHGTTYEATVGVRANNLPPVMTPYYKKPLLIHRGHMQWLFDHTGKRYLDLYAGIVTVSVGHCHPRVTKALQEQAGKLWHVANCYMHPRTEEYVERLVSTMPGDLKVVYLVNSGSEANEMAVMLARLYTGNLDIIALRNAYHGGSATCVNLNGIGWFKYPLIQSNIHHVKTPDVYRGTHGGKNCRDSPIQAKRCCDCQGDDCQASGQYAEEVNEAIRYAAPNGKIAGFIAESIQGVGGTVQYPKNYLKTVFEATRSAGGLCIADEVQTGWGRTGETFWSFQAHNVVPDIVTMAKGIGNGFPLGAVVTTPAVAQALTKAQHYNTYSGNPLACAVGNEVLKVIKDEKMQENSAAVGTYLLNKLSALGDKYSIIGDVRGKGLMIGVEMVSDRSTKTPLPPQNIQAIMEFCRENGVLLGVGGYFRNVFRIKPPMCITKEDADFSVQVFEDALQQNSSQ